MLNRACAFQLHVHGASDLALGCYQISEILPEGFEKEREKFADSCGYIKSCGSLAKSFK